jgi:hypothetical protein
VLLPDGAQRPRPGCGLPSILQVSRNLTLFCAASCF